MLYNEGNLHTKQHLPYGEPVSNFSSVGHLLLLIQDFLHNNITVWGRYGSTPIILCMECSRDQLGSSTGHGQIHVRSIEQ